MLTTGDEYFVRIVLLLLRGGRFASKKKIVAEVNKVHGDLDKILQTYKTHLKHLFLNKYYKKLFPSSGKTDIESWDIAMLTKVLLTVFEITLTDDEKRAVETIKSIRDEMYAHAHSSTLSSDEYNEFFQKLEDAMKFLCSQFDQIVIDECDRIIAACKADEIDESLKLELQRQLLATESLVQEVIDKLNKTEDKICSHVTEQSTSLKNDIADMRQMVIEEFRRLQNTEDRSLKKVTVIDSELTLSAPVNESEGVNIAEEIITTVINQAVEEVGDANDHPKIRLAVKKILSGIKRIPNVEIGKAERRCVILRFKCTTYKAVSDLLLYMESETYQTCLNELANAVSTEIFDNPSSCKLHAAVATECLKSILHELRTETSDSLQHKQTIRLPVKLQTVEGFENIWNLFEGNGASEHFQELSDAISEHIGTKITVTPSLDIQQVSNALMDSDSTKITESQTDSIVDTDFLEPSEAQIQETNKTFRSLIEVKSYSIKQASDSGFSSDVASSIDGQSNISEGRHEYMEGRFEPLIGAPVQLYSKDKANMATVGPIITLDGYDEKCFITAGGGKIDFDHVTVNGRKEALKVLAYNPNHDSLLIAPVGCHLSIVPQKEDVVGDIHGITSCKTVLNAGHRVFKVGAKTGLTHGVITDLSVSWPMDLAEQGRRVFEECMIVRSLEFKKPFANYGDSGALVFQEFKGDWSCVGLVIGGTTWGTFVVQPIKKILEGLERCIGRSIALDIPFMDPQVFAMLDNVKF